PGYTFAKWTENTETASSSASYSFTLGKNRNLVANFTRPTGRTLLVRDVSGSPGGSIKTSIVLVSNGDENTAAFSLSWNPALLSYDSAALGTGTGSGVSLVLNNTVVDR